ncbi:putative sulfate exporter family transporter [Maricaulis sp.]|uniref:YeiH family protein n=1 Tax=Maricaulis sp. TaxID=1486257 RepID=UPI001B0A35C5|nr:putative sulfate exporter family transporter [Maricaulis sp.]MBO6795847.1 putative sulfate exporter family transporter [Maricaulis sp.]
MHQLTIAREYLTARARGTGVCVVIALAASFLASHYGAPVMLFALLLGMAMHFLFEEDACIGGIEFCSTTLLRIGVALLGARVSLDQLMSLGPQTLVLTPALVAATLLAGWGLAKLLGRSTQFGLLVGGAVAICGASAALAIAAVLPRNAEAERDTLFTVVAVTALSTLAMIAYPLLFSALHSSDAQIGFLIGVSIHDVAQVVGAGYATSDATGDVAVFVKLLRVALLPVVVLVLALAYRRPSDTDNGSGVHIPLFVIGFMLIMTINSVGLIPAVVSDAANTTSRWLLITAIAALGVKTSLKSLAKLGWQHMGVAVLSTLFLLLSAVASVWLLGSTGLLPG